MSHDIDRVVLPPLPPTVNPPPHRHPVLSASTRMQIALALTAAFWAARTAYFFLNEGKEVCTLKYDQPGGTGYTVFPGKHNQFPDAVDMNSLRLSDLSDSDGFTIGAERGIFPGKHHQYPDAVDLNSHGLSDLSDSDGVIIGDERGIFPGKHHQFPDAVDMNSLRLSDLSDSDGVIIGAQPCSTGYFVFPEKHNPLGIRVLSDCEFRLAPLEDRLKSASYNAAIGVLFLGAMYTLVQAHKRNWNPYGTMTIAALSVIVLYNVI